MSAVKLVAVFVENKPGQLARVSRVLHEAAINIRWINIAASQNFGVIRLLVDRCEAACTELRLHNFTVSQIDVLALEVRDKPGGLHAVAELLAEEKINIENASGFVTNTHRRAVLVLETNDLERARKVLEKQKLHFLTRQEILTI